MRHSKFLDKETESDPPIRIVLVGKTGSGKSAAGNTILGRDAFKCDMSPESVTKQCWRLKVEIDGKTVEVVDTPGVCDTNMSGKEIRKALRDLMADSKKEPIIFLLVLKLGRFTAEEQECVSWIEENFGKDALKYFSILLFTHADLLKGKSIDQYIQSSPQLSKIIKKCGERYHLFNNEEKYDRTQVSSLVAKIKDMRMKGERYTNAMFTKAQKKLHRKEQMDAAKDVAMGVGSAVGTAGAVAGGLMLGATPVFGAVALGGGAVLATGGLMGLLSKKLSKYREKKKKK